jgi:CheY-like chemotaxis protein
VVEDHPDHRQLLRLQLEGDGARVKEASHAREAVEILETFAPALVLTDMRMPGEDGVWLLNATRQLRPGTAVVAVTGVADPESVLEAGFDAVLQKPFRLEEVSATARRVLARAA